MNPKIIFLDVDGPLITGPMYALDHGVSMNRSYFSTHSLGLLLEMVKATGALIVMNTAHNNHDRENPFTGGKFTVKDDLLEWGMPEAIFHSDWKTEYPNTSGRVPGAHPRMVAVDLWLEKNGPADWVAFDDDSFSDTNQVLINFEKGIDNEAVEKAKEILFRQQMENAFGPLDPIP